MKTVYIKNNKKDEEMVEGGGNNKFMWVGAGNSGKFH